MASRDFLDPQRYNLLEPLGEAMGLDMTSNTSLWKDEVSIELNKAVLHSYKEAGVSIVDHYSMADSFVEFMSEEVRERGGIPADWVWIVPPQSGSLVSTFHQEMINYHLTPSYEYQDKMYEKYLNPARNTRLTFKAVAKSVHLFINLMRRQILKRKKCTVFYSTETGTAKRFSKEAVEQFSLSFRAEMKPLDAENAKLEELQETDLAIFIVSTFGSGDAPDMSKGFTNNINKTVGLMNAGDLTTIKQLVHAEKTLYSVFGLGSTHYPKFAAFGKYLDETFDKLGFSRLCEFDAGDELNDQRGSFSRWLRKTFSSSLTVLNVEAPVEQLTTVKKYKWKMKNGTETPSVSLSNHHSLDVQRFVLSNRTQLHQERSQSQTLLLEFDGPGLKDYEPGDHLSIFPQNDRDEVDFITSKLSRVPAKDKLIELQSQSRGQWETVEEEFPQQTTFENLMLYFLNISETPSQRMLGILASHAQDEEEAAKLNILSAEANMFDLWKQDRKTMAETLQEFPSIRLNSGYFASLMSLNKARRYSIASSPADEKLSLIVGLLEYQTVSGRSKTGLTTNMLSTMNIGTEVQAFLKYKNKTPFSLPSSPATPVIMIAAGTGIAPFRGFWRHRCQQHREKKSVGKTILYFGCRKKSLDLLADETRAVSREIDFERVVAYSREQAEPRQYVQNLVKRDAPRIMNLLLRKGAHLYICGKVSMANDVRDTLIDVLMLVNDIEKTAAQEKIDSLREQRRYQEDIFG